MIRGDQFMELIVHRPKNYQINYILEEEEKKEEYYNDLNIPSDEEELVNWWDNFYSKSKYPFYGIILASTADHEIVSLLQNHRDEIAEISGKECCFIYFRNIETAKKLITFRYEDHAKWVYPLANLIGIDYNELPCFLFFRKIYSGNYIIINLRNKSQYEIIILLREIFEYLKLHKYLSSTFSALSRFKRSKKLSISFQFFLQNIIKIGRDKFYEMIRSLIMPI